MSDRCVCCGDLVPEGKQCCWACEHGYTPKPKREALPYWQDVLAANNYAKDKGWRVYNIHHDLNGYTVTEVKGAQTYGG